MKTYILTCTPAYGKLLFQISPTQFVFCCWCFLVLYCCSNTAQINKVKLRKKTKECMVAVLISICVLLCLLVKDILIPWWNKLQTTTIHHHLIKCLNMFSEKKCTSGKHRLRLASIWSRMHNQSLVFFIVLPKIQTKSGILVAAGF